MAYRILQVSYHVHEKGILFPLAPLSLLWSDWPIFVTCLQLIGSFSLHKLLLYEGSIVPYLLLTISYPFICCSMAPINMRELWNKSPLGLNPFLKLLIQYLFALSVIAGLVLHCLDKTIAPPPDLPDLYLVITVFLSGACFTLSYIVGIYWLWAGMEVN